MWTVYYKQVSDILVSSSKRSEYDIKLETDLAFVLEALFYCFIDINTKCYNLSWM